MKENANHTDITYSCFQLTFPALVTKKGTSLRAALCAESYKVLVLKAKMPLFGTLGVLKNLIYPEIAPAF